MSSRTTLRFLAFTLFQLGINSLFSQNFQPINASPFQDFWLSASIMEDLDNDGDLDYLISGDIGSGILKALLYKNDGKGNFTEFTPNISGIKQGEIAVADVDGDHDLDLLLTGDSLPGIFTGTPSTTLYINDGCGSFTKAPGTPFEALEYASCAFGDIDNDNDEDLIICGVNTSNQRVTKLYKNNGSGIFTPVTTISLPGIQSGKVKFADVDNDNDIDLLISGIGVSSFITRLYKNTQNGLFTPVTNQPFDTVFNGDFEFADINGTGALDLILTGEENNNQYICKSFINDGTGNFTLKNNPAFIGVEVASIKIADVDNDQDLDVIVTGKSINNIVRTEIYLNDGIGNYIRTLNNGLLNLHSGSIEAGDINNDGDVDIFLSGTTANFPPYNKNTRLYRNNDIALTNQPVYSNRLDTLCTGDSLFIYGSYKSTPGIYYSCDSLSSTTLSFTPSPTVSLSFFSPDTLCLNNSPVNLPTASPPGGIYSGNGINNNMFNPSLASTGLHAIVYTFYASNLCSAKDTTTITVQPCTVGLKDDDLSDLIEVYPNPVTDKLFINLPWKSSSRLQLYNSHLQLVKQLALQGNSQLDLSDLSEGLYVLSIKKGNKVITKKIIIQ